MKIPFISGWINSKDSAAIDPKAEVNDLRSVVVKYPDGRPYLGSDIRTAGMCVSEHTALSLSAVFACVRIISETVGTLPIGAYQKVNGQRIERNDHEIARMLRISPNQDVDPISLIESIVAAQMLHGEGYLEKLKVGTRIVGLRFIPKNKMTRISDDEYRVTLQKGFEVKTFTVKKSNLIKIIGFSLDGGESGISAIEYAAGIFGGGLAANQSANATFKNGLNTNHVFKMDKLLNPTQRKEFRENLQEVTGAMNSGRSPLLEGGMDIKGISINPKDAQLLESRTFSVEEICRWFRVDPSLVGHGGKDSNFGTGLEQKMMAFLTLTVRPYLVKIEKALTRHLFTPYEIEQGYYFEFNLEGLLRGDSAARATFYSQMVNNGVMSRDEVRAKENLPLKGGNADKLTVQSAMITLDSLGNVPNE